MLSEQSVYDQEFEDICTVLSFWMILFIAVRQIQAILVSGFGRSVFKSFDNMGGGKLKLPQVVCTQQYNLNE